jgi:hypothetical protein
MKAYYTNHKLHALPRKGRKRPNARITTPEIDLFILEHYKGTGHQEMADMVNERFGTSYTKEQIKCYYSRNKLNSGLTGYFKKGSVPFNKGKKYDEIIPDPVRRAEVLERMKPTQFRKGHVPHNEQPLGTVKTDPEGYLIRKISMTGTARERWEFVHRAEWEKHHGPIPEGMAVSFRDSNKLNCDIDNLMLISLGENAMLNSMKLRSENPELTDTALNMIRLINTARQKKK